VHDLRQHQGNNALAVTLGPADGARLRLPACERFQVVFDTPNALELCTLAYELPSGTPTITNAFLTLTGPSISAILVYPGPDVFLRLVGPVGRRAVILTSGNQWQGADL
jgi:hypothetical protein